MAKPIHLNRLSLIVLRLKPTSLSAPYSFSVQLGFKSIPALKPALRLLSTATRYPLQYEMIISRPVHPPGSPSRRRERLPQSSPADSAPDSELGFDDWVDKKLASTSSSSQAESSQPDSDFVELDKAKRKYYNKRRRRMFGSDSEDERSRCRDNELVELKQEVVELRGLHKREEELYFYDAFAYPWEKNKHYKMVYQLEKKYFPDQCFDKAFLEPGQSNEDTEKGKRRVAEGGEQKNLNDDGGKERALMFFEEERKLGDDVGANVRKESNSNEPERKVEDFFKGLKKLQNMDTERAPAEPFLASRSHGLPPKWDGPAGTVVLVNKPKGWTSFTVCGKLRRLVQVKKVGHAGTLDPMATGLLIVCIGKATKLVENYQGMIKGYSGIFRLGEATSTWDAESPVIQRESWEHIKDEDLKKAAVSFCGEIWQVPPMFSAIKVGGERMYDKARRGENIELSPRKISIFQFEVERSLDDRQNVIFRVMCSKGTYIRSLCADFGKALGSCAHLTALRRDSIGEYSANDAWEFQELEEAINRGYM